MSGFSPRLDVLPAVQRRLWPELAGVPQGLTLYGGTALALHLGHRVSVDFDFFAVHDIVPETLLTGLPVLEGAQVLQVAPNTLDVVIDRGGPVKLSFFGLPGLRRLRPPLVCADNGVGVASLLDLAATKLSVVQQRSEAKDYLDIAALIVEGRMSLSVALAAAVAVYGARFNPQVSLKALSYFGDGNLHTVPAAVRRTLSSAVRAVDVARLPTEDELP